VTRVDRHDDVIQQRERKPFTEQPLHEGKIKADAHAVLMPFTMEGRGWKQAAIIKVDVQAETTGGRRQLRGELALVVFIDRAVERAEILLHFVVKAIQLVFHYIAVGIIRSLRTSRGIFGRLVLSHCFAIVNQAKLRRCEECLRIERRRLIGNRRYLFSQAMQVFGERFRCFQPAGRQAVLQAREAVHRRQRGPQPFQVGLPSAEGL